MSCGQAEQPFRLEPHFFLGKPASGGEWVVLHFLAAMGTAVIGYHVELSGTGRSLALLALVLAFSAVMTLIYDLDRPQEKLLQVSQQTMIDLQRSMGPPNP
jgi:hypothetical protein